MKHSSEEIENCITLLANLVQDTEQLANLPEEQRIALLKATGEISRPDRTERKKRNKTARKTQSLATLEKNRRANIYTSGRLKRPIMAKGRRAVNVDSPNNAKDAATI